VGKAACEALGALIESESIDKLLSTFLRTLPKMADKNSRIHTALNLNTETGRLSSMRPNLQNQPALEKDVYGVRRAFSAQKGNKLIVVDYGQLELRIMAHMTDCTSMIEAFQLGGDFHSRTAIDMYPHVKEAVHRQEVLLEWNKANGLAPAPMLKDKYASERRKAKTLNFSIAYGKTKKGLAKDWGVPESEAHDTILAWSPPLPFSYSPFASLCPSLSLFCSLAPTPSLSTVRLFSLFVSLPRLGRGRQHSNR